MLSQAFNQRGSLLVTLLLLISELLFFEFVVI